MMITYVALDETGREVRGGVEASDRSGAAVLLRGKGLFPLDLQESHGPGPSVAAPSGQRGWAFPLFSGDKVLFLSQMALMLRSGLTLLQALETLAERSSRLGLRRLSRRVATSVQSGSSLSAALEAEKTFPPLVAYLVRAAEASGELEAAFERGAEYIDKRASLRYQIVTALTYPAIVVLMSAGVFAFLTTSVIPKFARFFAGRGRGLPWSTQALMDIAGIMERWGPTFLGVFFGLLTALLLAHRTERGALVIDRALLGFPVIGNVLRTAGMAHLGRTLGLLLKSGVPLLESLRVLSGSYLNRSYRRVVSEATDRVIQGAPLSQSLEHATMTPLALQVVAVGERSGSLDHVLEELGSFYERRLERLLRTLSSLVEPAVLVIVGGMVGFVYISFFQAVFMLSAPR